MSYLTSIAIFGDSIGRGSGDSHTSPAGQGDYLSGTSPTAPYINTGNYGWIERSIANLFPYINFSVQGKTAAACTAALMPKELAILDYAPPTHAIIEVGVNDLMQNASADTLRTRLQALMTLLRGRYNGIECYLTTVTPVSNSLDLWATTGNQFLSGTLPNGTTPYWAQFTDNTHTSGRSLHNYRVRNNLLGADGYIDSSGAVEDPTDERLWGTGSGARTADGIHPNQAAHTTISLCYNPATYFA